MYRILDQTWRTLPRLAPHYRFGVDDEGRVNYRAVRGPEYMRALRQFAASHGVTILDHSPVLELLAREDGSIGGAGGLRRQDGNRPYQVEAAAVVLAAGGTSFLSHLLGSRTNTGDGYLLAAEAGAEMSGMEFTAAYTIAPAHSTMTRSMAYSFATYYDADGRELDLPFGPDQTVRLARVLQRGPVYCSLHRLPDDVKARLHTISPNVPLVFAGAARAGPSSPNERAAAINCFFINFSLECNPCMRDSGDRYESHREPNQHVLRNREQQMSAE